MKNSLKIETEIIHGQDYIDPTTGSIQVPVYLTSTYKHVRLGEHRGFDYSRSDNPTRQVLENYIATLEKGRAGFAFASGMAAITAVLSLLQTGDRVLISRHIYGGTYRLLDTIFKQFGISYTFVDFENIDGLDLVLTDDVKAILVETPTNPNMRVVDIAALSRFCKKHSILSIVDNTFMTPYLQRPLTFGIDIVVHSATKYLAGHSDLIAGLVVVNDESLAEKMKEIQNATGGILQPFDSYLLLRGMKTLAVRMDRQVENAQAVADFLVTADGVDQVHYPGMTSAQGHRVQLSQATNGGPMLSFVLDESCDVPAFFAALDIFILGESLGGVESLICQPISMTHLAIPDSICASIGITERLIRLSVGIEASQDLIADIKQALDKCRKK